MKFDVRLGLSGHFKLEVKGGARGHVVLAEFDNLITDGGFDRVCSAASSDATYYCQIGTGNATPAFTDTALQTRRASAVASAGLYEGTRTYTAGPPDYQSFTRSYTFAIGSLNSVAHGSYTEIGLGWTDTGTLFCRALIDNGGGATGISVFVDEQLIVTYTLRLYPQTADATGTINLEGVDYAYTMRWAELNVMTWAGDGASGLTCGGLASTAATLGGAAYDGGIGTRASTPSGTSASLNNVGSGKAPQGSYVNGTFTRTCRYTIGLNAGNVSGGIKSLLLRAQSQANGEWPRVQIEFTPKVPKTASKVMYLDIQYTLTRH